MSDEVGPFYDGQIVNGHRYDAASNSWVPLEPPAPPVSGRAPEPVAPAAPQGIYADGQIVNGHRYDAASNSWVPLEPPAPPVSERAPEPVAPGAPQSSFVYDEVSGSWVASLSRRNDRGVLSNQEIRDLVGGGASPYATAERYRADAERHFGMAKTYQAAYEQGLRLPSARIDVNPMAHDAFVATPKKFMDTNLRLGKEASAAQGLEITRVTLEIFRWNLLEMDPALADPPIAFHVTAPALILVTVPAVIAQLEAVIASTDEPMLSEYGPLLVPAIHSNIAHLGTGPVPLASVLEYVRMS